GLPAATREAWLARLGGTRWAERLPGRTLVVRRLQLAGGRRSLQWVQGLRLALALAGTGTGVLAATFAPPLIILAPLGAALGIRVPEVALARRASARQQEIGMAVPDLVELLIVVSDAGLGPPAALRRALEALHGPLAEELGDAVQQLDLGLPWRDAMARLVDRTECPPLRRLVAALAGSHRLGAPAGPALRTIADDLRAERRSTAEDAARRAPVTMLFPLVFLILPAFLLLTVGPVLL